MGISDDETTILYVKPFRRSFDVNRAMTVEKNLPEVCYMFRVFV